MNTCKNAIYLLQNKETWKPYLRWVTARAFFRKPRISFGGPASIGEWISFSEYFSYHNGVSAAELSLLQRVKVESGRTDCVGFDVGANVGLFTCSMADAGFTQVHSFEPIPETFVRLKKNVGYNAIADRCFLNCVGVGSVQRIVRFAERSEAPGVNRLATSGTPFPQRIQQVAIVTLDEYCSEYRIAKINLAKIDVEGMEELVLTGASELIKRRAIAKILIEIAPMNQPQVGLHIDGLLSLIAEMRYECHKLLPDGNVGQRLEREYLRTIGQENIVLVPRMV